MGLNVVPYATVPQPRFVIIHMKVYQVFCLIKGSSCFLFKLKTILISGKMHITLNIYTGNDASVRTTKSGTDHSDDSENTIYSTTSIKSLRHRNTNINLYRTRKHDITVFSTESSKPTLSIALVSTVAFDGDVSSPDNVTNSNTFLVMIMGL